MIVLGVDYNHKNSGEVLKCIEHLKKEGIPIKIVEHYKELIDSIIYDDKVIGGIRGNLSSSKVIPYLRKKIGIFYRGSLIKNPYTNNIFLLSPVGIDEVKDRNDIIKIIEYSMNFMKKNNNPKIGLLSYGRLSDYGRGDEIDKSLNDCEYILKYFEKKYGNNITIEHRGILIEEYLKEDFNIIIPYNGIMGNIIFRCLGLVCNLEGYGAVPLCERAINYIDTSRSGGWKRYYNAVKYIYNNYLCKKDPYNV